MIHTSSIDLYSHLVLSWRPVKVSLTMTMQTQTAVKLVNNDRQGNLNSYLCLHQGKVLVPSECCSLL